MLCAEDDHNSYDCTGITRVVIFHATSQHCVTEALLMNYYRAIDLHHQAVDESYYLVCGFCLIFRTAFKLLIASHEPDGITQDRYQK